MLTRITISTLAVSIAVLANGPKLSGASLEPITNSLGMKLVPVPAGEFVMGADEDAADTLNQFPYARAKWVANERPRHKVRIRNAFYMGQCEVTLGQFLKFYHQAKYTLEAERDGKPSAGYAGTHPIESPNFRPWAPGWEIGRDHPAVYVSWNDVQAFCDWLSQREHENYRLPTEAEWEYACRAGTTTRYSFGNDPEDLVRYANAADQDRKSLVSGVSLAAFDRQGKKTDAKIAFPFLARRDGYAWTAPVATFRPNAFGLYDMQGNVWEWCSDWYDEHYFENSPTKDPQGPAVGSKRVLRGGGFNHPAYFLRCAERGSDVPSCRSSHIGFRVVRERVPSALAPALTARSGS